jgi:peptide/nickel transport system permease protein
MTILSRFKELKTSMRPRIKEWRFMLMRIRKTPLALVGLIIIVVFAAIAVLSPVLAPPPADSYDVFRIPRDVELGRLDPNPTPPTIGHIFGTTDEQYDLYYACIWGTLTAFRTGLSVVGVSLIIGLIIGTVAAYYGGLMDEVLMRFTDIVIAFPGLVLAMALVIAFPTAIPINVSMVLLVGSVLVSVLLLVVRPSKKLLIIVQGFLILSLISIFYMPISINLGLSRLDKVLIAITLVGWPGYTRVIRGEIMRVKNEDYVEASRASGSSDFGIILRHIWPNTIYPILIVATLDIGSIVLSAAALSFIGIGADPDYADWGQIIQRSRTWIGQPAQMVKNFHTFLIPGLFITSFVMGWNLLGDALRDVLDPTLRRK